MKLTHLTGLLAACALGAAILPSVHAADPDPKPAAAAATTADGALSAKVKAALADLKDVKVEASEGAVKLSGSVKSKDDADRAIQLASAVDGVKKVTNEIVVAK
jgi:hyperosmotically inducible protein